MLKWKMAAVLGLSIGVAGVGWGYAQPQKVQGSPGFYELRIYTARPGKRDALAARFASRTAGTYARHGITNVGYWIPLQTDKELGIDADDTFIYIRGYPSRDERDKRLKAAHDDPEFGEVVLKQERDANTRLIVKAHNIDMVPSGRQNAITITP
jgi:NIPSNAP protein